MRAVFPTAQATADPVLRTGVLAGERLLRDDELDPFFAQPGQSPAEDKRTGDAGRAPGRHGPRRTHPLRRAPAKRAPKGAMPMNIIE